VFRLSGGGGGTSCVDNCVAGKGSGQVTCQKVGSNNSRKERQENLRKVRPNMKIRGTSS